MQAASNAYLPLALVRKGEQKPEEVQLRLLIGPPIKELGKSVDGFQCAEIHCDHMTISKSALKTHCKKNMDDHGQAKQVRCIDMSRCRCSFEQRAATVFCRKCSRGRRGQQGTTLGDKQAEIDGLLIEWKKTEMAHEEEMQNYGRRGGEDGQDRMVQSDRMAAASCEAKPHPSCARHPAAEGERAEAEASRKGGRAAGRAERCWIMDARARDETMAAKRSTGRDRSATVTQATISEVVA
ncbi:hypothetical protein K469DRAFT_383948 [Zopfia rhizophila CBS 207.26]|uniref:Uncharacterized protein n=1 Tax=Zopfia rhizophila CBS 207.26 TaxID=1314779 RepID=A0A6A6EJR3_9PEZI|nr:hypothetical protein K469DRAFT_383948 [Zopfia rhizophila CBS 207.26]